MFERLLHALRDDGSLTHRFMTPGGAMPRLEALSTNERALLYRFRRGRADFYIQCFDRLKIERARVLACTSARQAIFGEICPIDLGLAFGGADVAYKRLVRRLGKPQHVFCSEQRALEWHNERETAVRSGLISNAHIALPAGVRMQLQAGNLLENAEFLTLRITATGYTRRGRELDEWKGKRWPLGECSESCVVLWPAQHDIAEHAAEILQIDPAEAEARAEKADPGISDAQRLAQGCAHTA